MVLAARSGAQLLTAECWVLRVDELGWQECGTWTGDRGPGCQVARQEELLPSPGLILVLVIIQQGDRHQRFCSNISAFHMGPKIDRKPGNSKAGGKMVRLFCCWWERRVETRLWSPARCPQPRHEAGVKASTSLLTETLDPAVNLPCLPLNKPPDTCPAFSLHNHFLWHFT